MKNSLRIFRKTVFNKVLRRWHLILVLPAFAICVNCYEKRTAETRLYFTIDLHDRKILIPVQFNDSVTARMVFDTGCPHGMFSIDSAFAVRHPSVMPPGNVLSAQHKNGGSSWKMSGPGISSYKYPHSVTIGNKEITFSNMSITEWKKHLDNNDIDGVFSIPKDDTTHVWELNFENSYLEIHEAKEFVIPKESYFCKTADNSGSRIQLPLKITQNSGDTLFSDHIYSIDCGMPWDIVLLKPTREESAFFDPECENTVWTRDEDGYYLYHAVSATLFGNFPIDSLRIYTFDNARRIGAGCLIGLNFLKRFNVFFDMKNKQVALQPIKNFKRIVNPDKMRYHYGAPKTPDGRYIVTEILNKENNYFKKAGLRIGDEIIDLEGSYNDTIIMNLIRSGKPLKLIVPVDKNEKWGD